MYYIIRSTWYLRLSYRSSNERIIFASNFFMWKNIWQRYAYICRLKETSDGFIDNYAAEHISMHLKYNVFRITLSSCKYCDLVILKGSWKCTFEQFYAFCMHTQFGNRLGKSWFCGSNGNERNEFRMRKWIKDFPIIAYCPVYYTIYLILPQAELYLYA